MGFIQGKNWKIFGKFYDFFRIFIVIGIKINKIELKNFENQESFKIYFYYGVDQF